MRNAPQTHADETVWTKRGSVEGLKTAAQKSVSSARPLRSAKPAGVCIHEFATRIQNAESVAPAHTRTDESQRTNEEMRRRPKRRSPRKPDSRKNAKTASAASGAPKTSPTNRE